MDVCDKRDVENLKAAFDVLEDRSKIPGGHIKYAIQLFFDALITLAWKSRWVKDKYRAPEPE